MIKKLDEYYLYLACYLAAFSYGSIYLLLKFTQKYLNGTAIDFGNFLLVSGISAVFFLIISASLAKKFGANITSSVGILFCGFGIFGLVFLHEISFYYYLLAVFVGFGWSLYHASSSMFALSPLICDSEKGRYISLISVCIVIGTSSLPVIYNLGTKLGFHNLLIHLFLLSGIVAFISAMIFIYLGKKFQIKKEKVSIKANTLNLTILKTDSAYFFLMVFLGACVFSTMMMFQLSYADERNLNYAIFFIFYTIFVILSRILFGGILTKKNPIKNLPMILVIMIVSLLIMLFNQANLYLYIISSSLLVISYGLAYPLIKTFGIKVAKEENRH